MERSTRARCCRAPVRCWRSRARPWCSPASWKERDERTRRRRAPTADRHLVSHDALPGGARRHVGGQVPADARALAMGVVRYERIFLSLGAALLVIFLAALGYAAVGMGMHLPGHAGNVDPKTVRQTPPFDSPGVTQVSPGRYEVVLLGQANRRV